MHILAYAGGGGSAKTGIGNTVNIQITGVATTADTAGSTSDDAVSFQNNNHAIITIDTGVEIAVALDIMVQQRPPNAASSSSSKPAIYLAVGIGNFVKVYFIQTSTTATRRMDYQEEEQQQQQQQQEQQKYEAVEIGSLELPESSGVNTVGWNSTGDALVAGCENGTVCIVSVTFENEMLVRLERIHELKGHIRAVCCCVYHPRNPLVLMSSAKDGTCRIWNLGMGPSNMDNGDNGGGGGSDDDDDVDNRDNKCMEELQCRIYDPNGPKPKAANVLNPKPGQCLVRGCAFGDLDGRVVYTVQSGRKGGAFLSVWKLIRRAVAMEQGEEQQQGSQPSSSSSPRFVFEFKETMRKQVSNFPVSAMSLSGDYSTLALGDTNGCIILLSTDTFHKIKSWECAHDLPVTCIAARPLPLSLSGEDLTGVRVDAISASADNRLCYLTRQKKSTLPKKKKNKKTLHGGERVKKQNWTMFILLYPIHLMVFAMIVYAIKVSFDVCREDYVESHYDWMAVKECVLHTALWATSDRPGIAFIPH